VLFLLRSHQWELKSPLYSKMRDLAPMAAEFRELALQREALMQDQQRNIIMAPQTNPGEFSPGMESDMPEEVPE
jgi:hypothetical protein